MLVFQFVIMSPNLAFLPCLIMKSPRLHIAAREWQGPKQGCRNVTVRFLPDKKHVVVGNPNSSAPLRSIDLRNVRTVVVQVASSKNRFFFMLRMPREYDLVSTNFFSSFLHIPFEPKTHEIFFSIQAVPVTWKHWQ